MDRLKTILVAVDFSACSLDALRQANRVAAFSRAQVHALHVVEPIWYGPELAALVPTPDQLAAEANTRWAKLSAQVKGQAAFHTAVGHPAHAILSHVTSANADLLVMGEHSVLDAHRGIGHVAAACVQKAASKVLLVQEGHQGRFAHVLVGMDFSKTCLTAVDQAVRIAAQDQAALTILHVYKDPYAGTTPPGEIAASMPDFPERLREAVIARMKAFTQPLQHELLALKPTFVAFPGQSHAKAFIDYATTNKADLAVIGTRAAWNFRDAFLGSTAERIIRNHPCSVLAIKPEGFEQPLPTAPHHSLADPDSTGPMKPQF
ncbi:MAG: universal stress protein [Phycisphaeraceae bacterium]|nr:MAG: universal stress protein [Phycisphaeraceae bacterium]